MKKFGLIGFPLTHSFSETYFREKFLREGIADCSYQNFPLKSIDAFPALIQSQHHLRGLNVTIPHKISVMEFLDFIDPVAAEIGAVNCIRISGGKLHGFNTDAFGFEQSIKPFLENKYERALILGSGGASRSIAYVLKKWGIPYFFVSRTQSGDGFIRYEEIGKESLRHFGLIVNTTPLGMFPHVEDCPPLPYEGISDHHFLYDTIYNPAETTFMKKGRERGAQTMNGLKMLELQAEESWRIWNDNMN